MSNSSHLILPCNKSNPIVVCTATYFPLYASAIVLACCTGVLESKTLVATPLMVYSAAWRSIPWCVT
jgi:hypothetical protein